MYVDVDALAAVTNGRQHGNRRSRRRDDNDGGSGGGYSSNPSRNKQKNPYKFNTEITMLSKTLRMIYKDGGTLAVLQRSQGMEEYNPYMLVESAIQASQGDKGMASGILAAILGSCCCHQHKHKQQQQDKNSRHHDNSRAQMAIDLMEAYDNSPSSSLKPDLVALALAYTATSSEPRFSEISKEFLRRAEQLHSSNKGSSFDTTARAQPTMHDENDTGQISINWTSLSELYGIELLQDSEEYVVVSKPSGMVCYHAGSTNDDGTSTTIGEDLPHTKNAKRRRRKRSSSNGRADDNDVSLEDCLLQSGVPLSTLNREGRGMVHRIDRGTSGCIVLAKTNRMHLLLMSQFFLRNIDKSYQALVCSSSTLKFPTKGTIDVNIDGRPAKSSYCVEESFLLTNEGVEKHHDRNNFDKNNNDDMTSLVLRRIEVQTMQGRRHQVRKHCAQGLKSPIFLDPLYGGRGSSIMSNVHLQQLPSWSKLRASKRFCLHANHLVIPEQGICAEAPLPDWWQLLEEEIVNISHRSI